MSPDAWVELGISAGITYTVVVFCFGWIKGFNEAESIWKTEEKS